ncbi:MAG: FtsX-like permease family protein [Bacteroidetes bacterium]|nr:FtsX-like permease family protein [Bacteroidota bacterium]
MKISKLIYNSLKFYKKQHLALLAGTIISTAVLTGALIIGDSVRDSLGSLVDNRLGDAEYVLQTGDRFVTSGLSTKIAKDLEIGSASVLQLIGMAIDPLKQERINKVQVLGIDQSFWSLSGLKIPELMEDEAFISENLAEKLNLKWYDEFLLRVANAGIIPLNAPFAEEKMATVSFRLKIKKILTDDEQGRYSLKSDQKAPYNVFLNQKELAKKLELKGLVNTILLAGNDDIDKIIIDKSLKKNWKLADASLTVKKLEDEDRIEVQSERIFMDEPISQLLNKLNPSEKVLSYLVNSISNDSLKVPYSFVSAISETKSLKNEITVNNWLADALQIQPGDSLPISYFTIGPLRELIEKQDTFVVSEIQNIGSGYFRKSLMPEFPGLTDAGSCSDWNTGIPIDLDKISERDEDYWDEYKGTPKAIISLDKGQELWSNKFGQYTSFRFDQNTTDMSDLEQNILNELNPKDLNLSFVDARSEGENAAENSIDFGELFLSLSFFVILAGLLLTILLHSLNTVSRSKETAILASIGFTPKRILKIRLAESSVVIVLGSIIGVGMGILYNQLLLAGLNSVWQDAVKTDMLSLSLKPSTLIIGGFAGLIMSFLSIYFVSRNQLKQQLAASLKELEKSKAPGFKWSVWISWAAFAGAIGLVIYSIMDGPDENSSAFLAAGFLILLDLVLTISRSIQKKGNIKQNSKISFTSLIYKNLGLHHKRNMASISLLALGTFSVIITGANRKTFYGVENDNQSGTGGYLYWAESSMPILHDLDTKEGRESYGIDTELFSSLEFAQLYELESNDASCLNLNLVQNPTILGCDPALFEMRSSFSFTQVSDQSRSKSPWLDLNYSSDDNIYYAIADQTVIRWGLMKEVGDTLFYTDEFGKHVGFILLAGLENSIFQGNILVSNRVFEKHFPSVNGTKVILVDGPEERQDVIYQMLKDQFVDLGMEISPTSQRLAEFNSVTNSYLTVFMMLGGLGILIGTIGLGIVLLRNLLDMKYELALLKALGYTRKQIFSLIISENLLILCLGLLTGIISAFIGILPSLLSPAFTLPLGYVFVLIAAILPVGFLSIFITAKAALKRNYLIHLRSE